jgi:protein ImuA
MRIVTSIESLRRALAAARSAPAGKERVIRTGLKAVDGLCPGGQFASGAVHEMLSSTAVVPFLMPVLLAKSAVKYGQVVWCDPRGEFYPPGAAAMGLVLERLLILRPKDRAEQLWAMAECLRCKGIGACIGPVGRLSRIEARRLQLAAETGGGIGIFLHSAMDTSSAYAAATRWLIRPAVGERMVQRWSVELIHGHGGRVGHKVFLEVCRETHHVCAVETVADSAGAAQTIAASA